MPAALDHRSREGRGSARGRSVQRCTIMDMMAEAQAAERRERRVIHLEVGQSGCCAPTVARAAAAQAVLGQPLGYTDAVGRPDLRRRIARRYREHYSVELDPARIIVTAGASPGFVLALTYLFDPGDRVGVCDPGYPSYRNLIRSLSLRPVGISTRADLGFRPQPTDLPDDIEGLIVSSPANPTGTMIPRRSLAGLVEAAAERGVAVISDEVYHGIHYGERAVSALEVSDDVYVINSFSKYFSMTGWRVGWMVVPPGDAPAIEALMQNLFICAPHVSQVAALAALDAGHELDGNLAVWRRNRDLLLEGLEPLGFGPLAPPDGAFFLYADVSRLTEDSRLLCGEILRDAAVAITPGNAFDPARGAGHVRICYGCSGEDAAEGLARLQRWAGMRRPGREGANAWTNDKPL